MKSELLTEVRITHNHQIWRFVEMILLNLLLHVSGGSVSRVDVVANAFEFYEPLRLLLQIIPSYDIDQITHSGTDVTVELLLDPQFNIPIRTGYGSTDIGIQHWRQSVY